MINGVCYGETGVTSPYLEGLSKCAGAVRVLASQCVGILSKLECNLDLRSTTSGNQSTTHKRTSEDGSFEKNTPNSVCG